MVWTLVLVEDDGFYLSAGGSWWPLVSCWWKVLVFTFMLVDVGEFFYPSAGGSWCFFYSHAGEVGGFLFPSRIKWVVFTLMLVIVTLIMVEVGGLSLSRWCKLVVFTLMLMEVGVFSLSCRWKLWLCILTLLEINGFYTYLGENWCFLLSCWLRLVAFILMLVKTGVGLCALILVEVGGFYFHAGASGWFYSHARRRGCFLPVCWWNQVAVTRIQVELSSLVFTLIGG